MPISFDTSNRYWPQTIYPYARDGAENLAGTAAASRTSQITGQKRAQETGTGNSSAAGKAGPIECQTCKSRKYQDGSDDPGVSFKSAAHIDPANSSAVVLSHEQEHVRNETTKATGEHKEVLSQTVNLETSVCPECGRVYTSGGVTRTVTRSKNMAKDPVADYYNKSNPTTKPRTLSVKA
jgi:hypothetical protein